MLRSPAAAGLLAKNSDEWLYRLRQDSRCTRGKRFFAAAWIDLLRNLASDRALTAIQDVPRGSIGRASDVGYHVIQDIGERHTFAQRLRVMIEHGALILNSSRGGPRFGMLDGSSEHASCHLFGGQRLEPFLSLGKRKDLQDLARMIEPGEVRER